MGLQKAGVKFRPVKYPPDVFDLSELQRDMQIDRGNTSGVIGAQRRNKITLRSFR